MCAGIGAAVGAGLSFAVVHVLRDDGPTRAEIKEAVLAEALEIDLPEGDRLLGVLVTPVTPTSSSPDMRPRLTVESRSPADEEHAEQIWKALEDLIRGSERWTDDVISVSIYFVDRATPGGVLVTIAPRGALIPWGIGSRGMISHTVHPRTDRQCGREAATMTTNQVLRAGDHITAGGLIQLDAGQLSLVPVMRMRADHFRPVDHAAIPLDTAGLAQDGKQSGAAVVTGSWTGTGIHVEKIVPATETDAAIDVVSLFRATPELIPPEGPPAAPSPWTRDDLDRAGAGEPASGDRPAHRVAPTGSNRLRRRMSVRGVGSIGTSTR